MSTRSIAVPRSPLSAGRRWALLATVGSGLLLIALDNSILYTALPTLTAELHATGSTALWIINAYPVVMAGLLLGSGTLGDRIGHRRMFLVGLGLFGVASLGAAFSPTAEVLIAARALLAVGAAAMMPATLALIRVTFEIERERNLAIAVWGSIAVVGAALGPIVGGVLIERFHWGSVFLINVPVVLVAIVATLCIAPSDAPDRSKHWDAISSAQAMLALVGAVFFIKELAHTPPNWPLVAVAALASVVGGVLFVRRQRRLDDPLLDFVVFRNAAFASGVVAAAATMFAIGGAQLVTTQRYQLVAGFTPLEAGLLVSTVAIGSLPTALLGGALLHRIGLRVLIAGGLALAAVGVLLVLVAMPADGLWLLVGALLVMGAGLGATMSVASTAIVTNVSAKRAGMASSVEEVSYEFGSLTAVTLLGSLLTLVYAMTVRLPDGAPDAAREGLPDAIAAAAGDPGILAAAGSAYDTAFTVSMVVLAVVLVAGAAITGRALRDYGPGIATSNEHRAG
ncbi:MFS transporter [Pseudoclavibacter chungangensis]|uniref:MFS transporter n=1 Tax=Pseudoclavibacter chungangensis TaxID=587635 RepID=A0A7J5BYI4_9MICO|nr:MFS transporter [Pseudoclavibacter chungangensis]KAB1659417.1 MFS transporter [Pseudoclavibacter chungangensis]NYJ67741.1 DHA2 family multidrug resistance protein-like MFS transporter [Pseudoclavibacter chungangensis]